MGLVVNSVAKSVVTLNIERKASLVVPVANKLGCLWADIHTGEPVSTHDAVVASVDDDVSKGVHEL
jgi:hypothetical protein